MKSKQPYVPSITANLVREKVRKMFPYENTENIVSILDVYGVKPYEHERERVQLAILDLAKGDKEQVAYYVRAACQDYRDVLYWAEYYENDPFRLLDELLQALQISLVLTTQEVTEVRRASGGTGYRLSLERLCQIIDENDKTILAEHYETIRRIGKIIKLPARLWKKISAQVEASPSSTKKRS